MKRLSFVLTAALGACPVVTCAASASSVAIGEILRAPDPLMLDGAALDGPRLRALYDVRGQEPLWITGADRSRVEQVIAGLSDAGAQGLDPAHYDAAQIAARRTATDGRAASELDVLLSAALLRYASDVRVGRRQPQSTSGEVDIAPRAFDAVAAVRDLATANDVRAAIDQLPSRNPEYQRLRDLLARYRKVAEAGGWGTVSGDGPALRQRLLVSGDLLPSATGDFSEAEIQDAVRRLQRTFGLPADGAVTKATRDAMNVPVGARIEQVRANMERWRWFPEDLGARHVLVNIVDFHLQLIEHGAPIVEMPVIVGKNDWRTPVISSQIEQLIFNPPWNVPPNIIKKEMIGRAKANAGYFNRIGLKVHRRGGTVRSSQVNWSTAGMGSFSLQQPPGPRNPLGRVKFQFPNGNGVYLHDTNHKGAFSAGFRAMSHGCIRVGNALGLAHALLDRDAGESGGDRTRAMTRDWTTRWVTLANPVPVHVAYATVSVSPDGAVRFARDFYGRDARLLEELRKKNTPVTAPPPPKPVATPTDDAPLDGVLDAPAAGPAPAPAGVPQETRVPGSPAT